MPLEISWLAIERTVSDGIAKPTPSLPPESLWIWALTPTTWPFEFSSGPPELPWLIAASVWIESMIVKLGLSEAIERCSALTMPLVTVSSSPNGLPIATTPVADLEVAGDAERKRVELRGGRVDLDHGEVGRRCRCRRPGA